MEIPGRLLIEIDGESGREIRISRTVDLLEFGDDTKRISDRLGEARDAIVITGDCDALTLMIAIKKKKKKIFQSIEWNSALLFNLRRLPLLLLVGVVARYCG